MVQQGIAGYNKYGLFRMFIFLPSCIDYPVSSEYVAKSTILFGPELGKVTAIAEALQIGVVIGG